jgi:TIR domain
MLASRPAARLTSFAAYPVVASALQEGHRAVAPGSPLPETASHIFICFSSKDEAVAREVVDVLESEGLKCWISVRDVPPGHNYQETIVQALEGATGVVFLFSEHSNKSGEIKKELSIGASIDIPVFPLRLSPITPTGALRYELAIRQWIDLFPHRRHALMKLVETIRRAIDAPGGGAPRMPQPAKRAPAKKAARAPRAPIIEPGSEDFEAIRALLARHVGPIAKVLVAKAATESATPDEFCERLAAHVPAAADRAPFVQALRARLTVKS